MFWLFHIVALFFAPAWLLLTVPLHVIYAALNRGPARVRDPDAPRPETHVRCPDCRELVRHDARVCKHCGCRLTPQAGGET